MLVPVSCSLVLPWLYLSHYRTHSLPTTIPKHRLLGRMVFDNNFYRVHIVHFVHIVQNLRNGQMDNMDSLVMLLFYNSHAGFFERIHVLAIFHSI